MCLKREMIGFTGLNYVQAERGREGGSVMVALPLKQTALLHLLPQGLLLLASSSTLNVGRGWGWGRVAFYSQGCKKSRCLDFSSIDSGRQAQTPEEPPKVCVWQ